VRWQPSQEEAASHLTARWDMTWLSNCVAKGAARGNYSERLAATLVCFHNLVARKSANTAQTVGVGGGGGSDLSLVTSPASGLERHIYDYCYQRHIPSGTGACDDQLCSNGTFTSRYMILSLGSLKSERDCAAGCQLPKCVVSRA
jgi:hypothetical protein